MSLLPSITSKDFLAQQSREVETKKLFLEMLRLHNIAKKENIIFYVSSGFVVDLACGKLLRAHGDLDLLIDSTDFQRFKLLMEREGYIAEPFKTKNPQASFKAKKEDIHVDVGAITILENQVTDVTDGDDKTYTWPSIQGNPVWQRSIDGNQVHFMSPEFILHFKTAANREKDQRDIQILKTLLA